MLFNILFVLTSALATGVSADEKAAGAALSSHANAQSTNPAWPPVISYFATKTAALKSFDAFQTSIASVVSHGGTLKSNYLDALPTEIRPIYSSYVDAQISIASKNGIVVPIEGKQTSVAKAAAPSAKPLGVCAVVVAGFLGAVAAL